MVERGGLENRCAVTPYPGFESLPLRLGITARMPDFNVNDVETEDCGGPDDVGLRDAPFHGERLGGAVVEIAPGKAGWPYHWEGGQEELVLVLSGRPTMRRPSGEEELAPGDVVAFPIGPDGAHAFRNATDEPVRLLMVSTLAPANVVHFPDSGKVLARSRWSDGVHHGGDRVPYWD